MSGSLISKLVKRKVLTFILPYTSFKKYIVSLLNTILNCIIFYTEHVYLEDSVDQRLENLFWKGPNNSYFYLCALYDLFCIVVQKLN